MEEAIVLHRGRNEIHEGDIIMILRRVYSAGQVFNKILVIDPETRREEFSLRENLSIDLDAGMKGMAEQSYIH